MFICRRRCVIVQDHSPVLSDGCPVWTGLVWFTKILTDPFHDIKIYYKSPYYLLKGDMYDDMTDWYDNEQVARNS